MFLLYYNVISVCQSPSVRCRLKISSLELQERGFRVEGDASGDRLGKQIRTAELEKNPVTAVVGKQEVEQQALSARSRQSGDLGGAPPR